MFYARQAKQQERVERLTANLRNSMLQIGELTMKNWLGIQRPWRVDKERFSLQLAVI